MKFRPRGLAKDWFPAAAMVALSAAAGWLFLRALGAPLHPVAAVVALTVGCAVGIGSGRWFWRRRQRQGAGLSRIELRDGQLLWITTEPLLSGCPFGYREPLS